MTKLNTQKVMVKKVYRHGGAKYNFDETKEGKLVLVSISIFGKNFVLPDGGIPESDVEQIVDNVKDEITKGNADGEINRMQEFADFLRGYPEGTTLEKILNDIESNQAPNLTDEMIDNWFSNDYQDDSQGGKP